VSAPVFLAEPVDGAGLPELSALVPGDRYVLGGPEGRHAGVVQRRRAGERIDVVDGRGARLRGVIDAVERDAVTVRVEAVDVEPAPSVGVVLVQALAKGDRDELAIEAATEVGVDAVIPWQAERSVVVWRGERAAKAHARWTSTVRAAAKQSRRAWVPGVRPVLGTPGLADTAREVVRRGGTVLVLHEDATTPIGEVELPAAAAAPGPAPSGGDGTGSDIPEVLVVVGPEGGISEGELARLAEAGARPVRLGPHVLRTSTAGPVAVALLCERLGRWG
jgi:16S rRNA (uracil1498-N3)-methyltransferase